MKLVAFSSVLTLSVCFVIFLNKDIVADNKDNSKHKKFKNKIIHVVLKKGYNHSSRNYRKYQGHVSANHLSTKEIIDLGKINLTKQMFDAKEVCWQKLTPSHRILNGTNVGQESLKWMAAIFKTYNKMYKDTVFSCGGAIISSKFVLTAAHCVVSKNGYNYTIVKSADLFVRYGMHDLSSKIFVEQLVERTFPYPEYLTLKGKFNDIALIKLKQPIKYTDVVNPICVPSLTTPDNWNELIKGKDVLISGWGRTDAVYKIKPRASLTLQKGYAFLVDHSVCKKWEGTYDKKTTLCLGMKPNFSTVCKGDSGSPVIPLACTSKEDNTVFPVVIGLVSFGDTTCFGPDILTKVESFINWINAMTI